MVNNEQNNPQNNQDDSPDNVQHIDTESEIFEKIAILQLMQKYGIGRPPFYERMKYLQITTWKVSGKAHLDAEQVVQMDGLHQHIKEHGRMDGYPVPAPSGPVEPQTKSAIVVQQEQSLQESAEPNYVETKAYSNTPVDDIAKVARRGAERAAAVLVGEDAVVNYLLENPEQLPADLRSSVEASRAKLNETSNRRQKQYEPDFFAQMAIAKFQ